MTEQPLIDISPENWRIVSDILQRLVPDREVWAFGSRAKWSAKEYSDLDIAVIGDEPLGLTRTAELTEAFQESALPFKVDVVDWATISPSFRRVIQGHHVGLQQSIAMASWIDGTLADVSIDVAYGYTASAENEPVGPHFLRITDIQGGYFEWKTVPHCKISEDKKKNYLLNIGDIVVARTGNTTGENAIIREKSDSVFASYLIRFRPDTSKVVPDFIWYQMRSPAWWHFVNAIKGGSAQPGANAKQLGSFPVHYPQSLDEQREISSVFRALDDKIALLRQTNATLEAIAQALFKSWFVDFDPVRAKAEGREPEGVPPEIAELFPSEFVESELGEIPNGWQVGRLGDIVVQRNERTKPSPATEQQPYVPIECISSKSVFLAESKSGIEAQSSLIKFYRDDILFGAMRPYFHKVCLAPYDGTTRTTAFVLVARKAGQTSYCLFQLFADTTIDFATNHSEGSTIPYAKWNDSLETMPIVIPPDALIEHFSTIVKPFIAWGIENIQQARVLCETRDLLLPRLMSEMLPALHEDIVA
jgi:type I restriction enzyme S subunit